MQAGLRSAVVSVAIGVWGVASAAPLERKDVPDPLRPWIGWALHGQESRFCPPAHDDANRRLCTWPSQLSLSLDENGGRFELIARTDAPVHLPLPGDAAHWPQDVTDGGREAAVLEEGPGPAVWVTPGEHRITGRFDWTALPESLRVPPLVGLVDLVINGKAIPHPGRDARSHLWLGKTPTAEPAAEAARLGLRVFRLIDDDLPARVTTHIEIDAGGEVREEVIGPVLLPGLVPLSVSGDLPARLEDDGRIRLQVRPGQWTVTLQARTKAPLAKLGMPKLAEPWPSQEVWSFQAHHDLRVVEAAGLAAVDPRQTGTPPDWQAMPAFLAEGGTELAFGEKQRGDPDPEPDQLHLARQIWLDFDGQGYTLQDQLTGKLSRTWRLDAQTPIALGRVQVDKEPQLITKNGDTSGVEVRHGALQLSADSRIDGSERRLPAAGWNTDLQGVDVTLHLPPAWRLFAAPGADNVPQTWLSQWTLLDLFLVLVASIAALRLFGAGTGLLTLITLALTWHEPGAPQWTWLTLIAAIALLRAVPPSFGGNRLRTFLSAGRWIAVGALAFVAIPYAVATARSSLYPQLENGPYAVMQAVTGEAGFAGNAMDEVSVTAQRAQEFTDEAQQKMVPMMESAPAPPPEPLEADTRRKARFASKSDETQNVSQSSIQRLDPNVLTQTGPGLPGWQWRQANLNWSGPVTVDQTFRLWLIPPWLTRTLGWASIALILLVVLRWIDLKAPRTQGFGNAASMLLVLMVGLAGAIAPEPAHAQDEPQYAGNLRGVPTPPSDAILQELRQRLTAPPDCMPGCAAFARMSVNVDGDRLLLRLVADAAVDTSLPLPLPPVAAGSEGRTWQPQSVLVDERSAALLRDTSGRLWVRLGTGRHTVAISGSLAGYSQVQIPFPAAPHRVDVNANGWVVAGVDSNGQPGAALDLSREKSATADSGADAATDAAEAQQALPPLFVLTRTVRMGLVWSVESTLERLGNTAGAHVATVDLFPGETVTGEAVRVVDGRVQASFAPSQLSIAWTGRLAIAPKLALTAAPSTDVFEIWRFDISPLWHADFAGLAPVAHQEADYRLSTFRPWPGEKVDVTVAKPEGVKGQVLTLDRASLRVQPGKRATDHTLTMTLRASQGGQHAIPLPDGLTLQSLTVDGAQQPARREGGRVVVPLHPGTQIVGLTMRGEEGLGMRLATPPLAVGLPGVNADVVVGMPSDRWVLLAGGPRLGPAVLFWGELVVLLVIAVGLSKTGITPLKGVAWSLLVIGLSQIPLWSAAIVAGWLFALALRGKMPQTWSARRVNAVQIVLALWTLAALSALFGAVAQGLLGTPDMQIVGNGSSAYELRWYQDRFDGQLPTSWVLSVSIWIYRGLMLAWALWLANSLLAWLRWGWAQYTAGGLWRKAPVVVAPSAPAETPSSDAPAQ